MTRARVPSIRRVFAVTLGGNRSYAAAQWALLLVLVRLGSPALVGEYALALAIGAPVVMFTNLRLSYLIASDADRSRRFADYFALRMAANGVALLGILVWATLGGYRGGTWWVNVLIGVAKIAEACSDLVGGYLGLRLSFRHVALSLNLRGWGSVAMVAALRLAGAPLVAVAGALAALWWAAFLFVDYRFARAAGRADDSPAAPPPLSRLVAEARVDRSMLRLAREALPLGFVALALSLCASVPRLFLEQHWGADEVGYFSALAYAMVAGRIVAVALGVPTLPRLGAQHAAGDRPAFVRTVVRMELFALGLGAAGVVAALLVGRPALALVYGPAYAAHADSLVLLLAAAALGYVANFAQDALVVLRRFVLKAFVLVATLGVIAAACAVLVPGLGLRGATYAILIGSAFECVGSLLVLVAGIRRWRAAGDPPERVRPSVLAPGNEAA